MSKHFLREIESLNGRIIRFGEQVEEQLDAAIRAVAEDDVDKAESVVLGDTRIDQTEVEIEEECLKLLALYQPVASDLRLVISVLKINNDLERIGDHAAHIAARARDLSELPRVEIPKSMFELAKQAKLMFRKSLLALVEMDVELAEAVLRGDDAVDRLNKELFEWLLVSLGREARGAKQLLLLNSVARRLERIGDHASNIAEDVIYLLSGEIIRHGSDVDQKLRTSRETRLKPAPTAAGSE
jgi:phosphate transport system protein